MAAGEGELLVRELCGEEGEGGREGVREGVRERKGEGEGEFQDV